jgi:hypothetical protein
MALEGFSWVAPLKRVACLDLQFAWSIGIGLIGSAAVLLLARLEARLCRGAHDYSMLLCISLLLHTILDLHGARAALLWLNVLAVLSRTPLFCLIARNRSRAFVSVIANLYLSAVSMAGLMSTARTWAAPGAKFPEISRSRMTSMPRL